MWSLINIPIPFRLKNHITYQANLKKKVAQFTNYLGKYKHVY